MIFKIPKDTDNIYLRVFGRYSTHKVAIHAGQSSFFLIMSFIPFIMMLIRTMSFFPGESKSAFQTVISKMGPGLLRSVISPILEENMMPVHGIFIFTIISLLWAGSKGLDSLMQGFDSIYGTRGKRGYLKRRAYSLIYMLGFIITIIIGIGLLIFGTKLYNFLNTNFNLPFKGTLTRLLLTYGIAIVVFIAFFVVLFRFLPYTPTETKEEKKARLLSNKEKPRKEWVRKPKYRTIKKEIPGALITATIWMVFTRFFAIYVEIRLENPSYYGNFASIFLTFLWVYFCMMFIFIGALFNNYAYRTGESIGKHIFMDIPRLIGWAVGRLVNAKNKHDFEKEKATDENADEEKADDGDE